jgi:hypothetical protein
LQLFFFGFCFSLVFSFFCILGVFFL